MLVAQSCDLDTMAGSTNQSLVRTEYHLDLLSEIRLVERVLFSTWRLTREGRAYIVRNDLDK